MNFVLRVDCLPGVISARLSFSIRQPHWLWVDRKCRIGHQSHERRFYFGNRLFGNHCKRCRLELPHDELFNPPETNRVKKLTIIFPHVTRRRLMPNSHNPDTNVFYWWVIYRIDSNITFTMCKPTESSAQ